MGLFQLEKRVICGRQTELLDYTITLAHPSANAKITAHIFFAEGAAAARLPVGALEGVAERLIAPVLKFEFKIVD
jgi:hypothetical protein